MGITIKKHRRNLSYDDAATLDEFWTILRVLADYDLFQFENHIKPDYSSAQGLEEWGESEREWVEWNSGDGLDIREYKEAANGT